MPRKRGKIIIATLTTLLAFLLVISSGAYAQGKDDKKDKEDNSGNSLTQRVAKLETTITGYSQTINTMQQTINSQKNQISSLTTDIATLKTGFATINTNLTSLQSDVSSLTGDLASLKKLIPSIQTDINSLQSRIDQIEARVAKLETATPPTNPPPTNPVNINFLKKIQSPDLDILSVTAINDQNGNIDITMKYKSGSVRSIRFDAPPSIFVFDNKIAITQDGQVTIKVPLSSIKKLPNGYVIDMMFWNDADRALANLIGLTSADFISLF
jgi:uncharacterized coiled-coil protein SlyX